MVRLTAAVPTFGAKSNKAMPVNKEIKRVTLLFTLV